MAHASGAFLLAGVTRTGVEVGKLKAWASNSLDLIGLPDQPFRCPDGHGFAGAGDGAVSHDRGTRFLSERDYTTRERWLQVKKTVRESRATMP
jgi:hypothetical protein